MSEPQRDLDPGEIVEQSTVEQYEDPTDPEITDPEHPDYVEPGVEYGSDD